MTRDLANEILFLWKVGAQLYPPNVINQALYTTGDLDGPFFEAEPRLVLAPSSPAWLESVRVESGSDDGEGGAASVLEAAGSAAGRDGGKAK